MNAPILRTVIAVWLLAVTAGACTAAPEDCRTGASQNAIVACTELLQSDPTQAAEWFRYRAQARLGAGDTRQALEDVASALAIDPVSGGAHLVRASIYLARGDVEAALSDAGLAVVLSPDDYDAHLVQGRALAALGADSTAQASFDMAAALADGAITRAEVEDARLAALAPALAEPDTARVPAVPKALPADTDPELEPGISESTPGRKTPGSDVNDAEDANALLLVEAEFWRSVKDSDEPADLHAYLTQYPDGVFAELARLRIGRLQVQDEIESTDTVAVAAPPDPELSPMVAACDAAAAHSENVENPAGVTGVDWDEIDEEATIITCRAALAAFPDHVRSAYHLGRAHHKAGNRGRAIRYYTQAADAGHVRAMAGLGILLKTGTAGETKLNAARRYLTEAAKAGDRVSQNELAKMFLNGEGVAKNDPNAVRWFREAAKQDYAAAQNSLGWMHENGRGVPVNLKLAFLWYKRAADQEYDVAEANLGWMYESGSGTRKDPVLAVRYYSRAAAQGLARGQTNLAWMYQIGSGVTQDYHMAATLYRKAADQGFARAQNNLGLLYEFGNGVQKNEREAARYYRLAAEQGHADGQTNFASMLETGRGTTKDLRGAFDWNNRAAKQGDARGQYNVGRFYLYGMGVPKDVALAREWLNKATQQDYVYAHNHLGWLYETERAFQNPRLAASAYIKALEHGEIWATTRERRAWDRATAIEVQRLLKRDGFYTGTLDGDVGRGTVAAMKRLCKC